MLVNVKSKILYGAIISGLILFSGCTGSEESLNEKSSSDVKPTLAEKKKEESTSKIAGKKILFVNSYHSGYAWSDGIEKAIKEYFAEKKAEVKVFYMDTKNNGTEEFKISSGEKAKKEIEAYKPDAVILSDDNAVKYVLQKYFKDSKTPFVFCGVNWDASGYQLPYTNTTGMLEVSMIAKAIDIAKDYKKVDKIGFIAADNETTKKEYKGMKEIQKINFSTEKYVKDFSEWKTSFKELQNLDLIVFESNAGIKDWNDDEAIKFVKETAKTAIVSQYDFMSKFTTITIAKSASEQGLWASKAVEDILNGKQPKDIEISKNKDGDLYLNVEIAKQANITFKPEILSTAKITK